jgi:hypothetical protein
VAAAAHFRYACGATVKDKRTPARLLILLATAWLAGACSSTSTLRLCNGRLEPINPPGTTQANPTP